MLLLKKDVAYKQSIYIILYHIPHNLWKVVARQDMNHP